MTFGVAVSLLIGGLTQYNRYQYTTQIIGANNFFLVDSATNNIGKIAPRRYYGIDTQLKIKNKIGFTELRAKCITGKQTASANSSETPGTSFSGLEGYYVRKFNGAYFYFLQNLGSKHHQIGIKYDWYDPNTEVKGEEIGNTSNNLKAVNIKFNTW